MANLTRPGLQYPSDQAQDLGSTVVFDPASNQYVVVSNAKPAPGRVKYFNDSGDAMAAANQALRAASAVPTVTATPGSVTGADPQWIPPTPVSNLPPMLRAALASRAGASGAGRASDPLQVQAEPARFIGPPRPDGAPNLPMTGTGADVSVPNPALPKFLKPSFRQAATDQYGNVKPLDGSTTKLGKLFQILLGAGEGAMAGQAANAETYARTGRNAGIGGGFEGAEVHPYEEAARQQAIQHGNLQNEEIQATINAMPVLRAAQLNRENAQTNWYKNRANASDYKFVPGVGLGKINPDGSFGGIVPNTANQGQNTPQARQAFAAQNPDLFTDDDAKDYYVVYGRSPKEWEAFQQNPDSVSAFFGARAGAEAKARAQYRAPAKQPTATPQQFAAATVRRGNAQRQLQNSFTLDPGSQTYVNEKTGETITAPQYQARQQGIQDQYDSEVTALGGVPRSAISQATATARNKQNGKMSYLIDGKWITEDQLK